MKRDIYYCRYKGHCNINGRVIYSSLLHSIPQDVMRKDSSSFFYHSNDLKVPSYVALLLVTSVNYAVNLLIVKDHVIFPF